jgi:hypothetical protein
MCKPQQNTRSYSTSVSRETNHAFHTSGFLKTNFISLLHFCEQILKYLVSNIIISTGPIFVTRRVADGQIRSIFGLDLQELNPITFLNINCMFIITGNVTRHNIM